MASAAPAMQAPVHANSGDGHLGQEARIHAQFYQQVLSLKAAVVAGEHPVIKLPEEAVQKLISQQPRGASPSAVMPQPARPISYVPSLARSAGVQPQTGLKPALSGIDPVLLTKSDDLVRAEIQLKRKRIEQEIKKQVEHEKIRSRNRDAGLDPWSTDVSDVLAKAHAIVAPVSGLRTGTAANRKVNEPFDEQSYYSSQANSQSPSDHEPSDARSAVEVVAVSSRSKATAIEPRNASAEADARLLDKLDRLGGMGGEGESDYEPPGAEVCDPSQKNMPTRSDPLPRATISATQTQGAPQETNSRKRRRAAREDGKPDKQRRVLNNIRVANSPVPFIKEEPVSPPPLTGLAEPAQRRLASHYRDDIDFESPRSASRAPVYYIEYDTPAESVPSRVAYRRAARADPDLRLVAEGPYAGRPHSPLFYGPYESVRPVTHAYPDGRARSAWPVATRYLRNDRSLSPHYAMDHCTRIRSPPTMAPPPVHRRVIVDQYGNRYYAEPTVVDSRASLAPAPRHVSDNVLYERAPARAPTLRPVGRVDPYDEDEAMPPLPPRKLGEHPGPGIVDTRRAYRQQRYTIDPREPVREEVLPPQEPPARYPPVRYDGIMPPGRGEYAARHYSVRPEAPAGCSARAGSTAPGAAYFRPSEAVPHGYRAVSVVQQGGGFDDRHPTYVSQQPAPRYMGDPSMLHRRPAEPQEFGGDPRNAVYRY